VQNSQLGLLIVERPFVLYYSQPIGVRGRGTVMTQGVKSGR
jgi:hypothetical protein